MIINFIMEIVSVKNMFFDYFEKKILHDINISINEGDIILLIGANGAGKSTLLRVLSGLHTPQKYDTFSVLGTSSPHDQFKGLAYLGNRWQRNISFCGVSPYMADIRAGDMMKKWQNENIDRRDELVKILDIDLDWKMHQVSDGQRKRVQIMLGLLKPFKFLIIDEFLNELDVVIRDRFFKYLTKECKLRNGAIIYATHVFDDLYYWANKVVYMTEGKCENCKDIGDFCKRGADSWRDLYSSVVEVMSEDYNKKTDNGSIDPLKFGPQFGFGSGRSSLIN